MNKKIAAEIQAEQEHGRSKYGTDPNDFAHDDSHDQVDWSEFIHFHNDRAKHETPMEWRQRMVKIAGLAVSAIESFDRKQNHAEEQHVVDRSLAEHNRKTNFSNPPPSSAYRITLSPHEWTWTQAEQEEMARAVIESERACHELKAELAKWRRDWGDRITPHV
jgi:hypothetical protein